MPGLSHRRWHSARFQTFFFFPFFSLPLSKPASIAVKSRKCYTRGIAAFVEETHLWWHNLSEMAATLPGPACRRDDILSSSVSFLIIFLLVFNPPPHPPASSPFTAAAKIPSATPSIYCTPLIHLWFGTMWFAFPTWSAASTWQKKISSINQSIRLLVLVPSNLLLSNPIPTIKSFFKD